MFSDDVVAVQRPGDAKIYQATPDRVVTAGVLRGLIAQNLLPTGTLTQGTAPTNTGVLWVDNSGNSDVLKKHNGTAWVTATFPEVYGVSPIKPLHGITSAGGVAVYDYNVSPYGAHITLTDNALISAVNLPDRSVTWDVDSYVPDMTFIISQSGTANWVPTWSAEFLASTVPTVKATGAVSHTYVAGIWNGFTIVFGAPV